MATAAAGFALSVLPFGPLVPPTPSLGLLATLFVTAYALVLTVVGSPLLVVGMSLAGPSSDER